MRDQAKTRQHSDVHFGLREKPKKTLPQHRKSVGQSSGGLLREKI
jgi:hypothetical protein